MLETTSWAFLLPQILLSMKQPYSDECSGDDDSVDNYHGMIITRLFNLQNKYCLFWLKMYNGINIYELIVKMVQASKKEHISYFKFLYPANKLNINNKYD